MPHAATEDVPILLAGTTDGRRVDDRHQFLEMVQKRSIEQRFIPILERDHENVPFQVGWFRTQVPKRSTNLFILRTNTRREESAKPESIPFLFGKGNSLVQNQWSRSS